MKTSTYKDLKLRIYEKEAEGLITEAQRDQLIGALEEKAESSKLTKAAIKDFFDELEDAYPDLEDDIDKLAKKIEDAKDSGDSGSDDESDDSSDDAGDGEDDDSENISESAMELLDVIMNM